MAPSVSVLSLAALCKTLWDRDNVCKRGQKILPGGSSITGKAIPGDLHRGGHNFPDRLQPLQPNVETTADWAEDFDSLPSAMEDQARFSQRRNKTARSAQIRESMNPARENLAVAEALHGPRSAAEKNIFLTLRA
jgi:hypothetical protein